MDETKLNIIRNILGSVLLVALLVIITAQFMKYLDEETNLSMKYVKNDWIELPSITICNLDIDSNENIYNQKNMTFEEFVKNTSQLQSNTILNVTLGYVNIEK